MSNAHDYDFTRIDGSRLALREFQGKAVLVVNTASECGFTPQYAGLQKLWEQYRDRGLVVLGVPSNDFGAQEPGDEAAIAHFCSERYAVDFPMTGKVQVIGGGAHPFYRWIAETLGEDAAPRWNFHKYLLGGDGELVAMWPSKVEPLSAEVTAAVEEALG
ncbi:MAG: glutathione peroxidase [Gammaproteobacteria bacterium]|nr:glutathione peroxidase [Gammaproteobacteria bacterium]NIM73115.1 glutathione peroxidase [Gammaproteobacteria bacterium]NIN38795.1 glutathione peroxidase [Gammaproteobacteria bacterium]NIO24870.1 glutathione peroxidase [Gammaproteobacteria bacterium]NIO65472.1 glutathione peroxidase [Gammaproteobacteria bacterium]